jgi:metal-sulfur cluster biosynthetic enzyme
MVNEAQVWDALGTVMDPEIPFSIVDLGLVYGVWVEGASVRVQVTLTTRGCPLVRRITDDAAAAVRRDTGAEDVEVEVVWDPPWHPSMAAEQVRNQLGWI